MATDDLLDLCMRLRRETGRSVTEQDRARLAKKISWLSSSEVGAEKKTVVRWLTLASGSAFAATRLHRSES